MAFTSINMQNNDDRFIKETGLLMPGLSEIFCRQWCPNHEWDASIKSSFEDVAYGPFGPIENVKMLVSTLNTYCDNCEEHKVLNFAVKMDD